MKTPTPSNRWDGGMAENEGREVLKEMCVA